MAVLCAGIDPAVVPCFCSCPLLSWRLPLGYLFRIPAILRFCVSSSKWQKGHWERSWAGPSVRETTAQSLDPWINRGQTRNSGKVFLGPMLQYQGARTRNRMSTLHNVGTTSLQWGTSTVQDSPSLKLSLPWMSSRLLLMGAAWPWDFFSF